MIQTQFLPHLSQMVIGNALHNPSCALREPAVWQKEHLEEPVYANYVHIVKPYSRDAGHYQVYD